MSDSTPISPRAAALADSVWQAVERRRMAPRATYRLEFRKDHFTFRDARAVVPYLAALGISHVYSSPCLKTYSGAAHGYAIVDYGALNPHLGTRADYDAFVAALHERGLGQILDVVPNHMGAAAGENEWWTDVLQHGEASPWAGFFDIDWLSGEAALRHRLLLPILGESFGRVLEQGQLKLSFAAGRFQLHYFQHRLPLSPLSYSAVLGPSLEQLKAGEHDPQDALELESILTAIRHLPVRTAREADQRTERLRETIVIQSRLGALAERSASVVAALDAIIQRINGHPQDPASFNQLEQVLDQQVYRLARWKTASDEINYRRFFDVNELAAICTERLDVFQASHQLIFELLADGAIDGLRIDHVDGLYDPRTYLWRLQWGYLDALLQRELSSAPGTAQDADIRELRRQARAALHERLGGPAPETLLSDPSVATGAPVPELPLRAPLPLYVVVEKILGADEPLPANWPVAGTTGYDFLNEANGLFVDPAGLVRIRRSYQRFSRLKETFDEIAADSKRLILDVAMSSELHLLARRLKRVAERDRHARDFTLNSLLAALREVIVAFPVYRTYAGAEGAAEGDVRVIQRAIRRARRRNPAMDGDLFDFIQGTLCPQTSPDAAEARRLELFVGRFQQSTSPVMAKGIEDTAFYRDVCLASVNEVGAHPAAATVSIDQFHAANLARAARSPEGMICTSTHDTKRSEDVRSRLNVLSEIPDVWRTTLARWARWNRHFVAEQQGEAAPSRNDEYLFYQSVLGVWPSETPSPEQHEELERRLLQYMQKATHEAKLQTSWLSPNPEYDDAVRRFVQGALRPETGNRFLEDVQSLVRQIAPAALLNSLSGTLLKLTCPGVPDFYQGSELWDDSLVDPDNRRPVDFPLREKLLAALRGSASGDHLPTHGDWSLEHLADPSSKLFLTWRLLQARRRRPELFQSGAYVPLALEGPLADCFCAFARTDALSGAAIIVMAPRLTWKLLAARRRPSAESPDGDPLQETKLRLPDEFAGEFQHLITGETFERPRSLAALATWLDRLPLGAWFARGGQAPRSGVCLSSAATLSVAPASP